MHKRIFATVFLLPAFVIALVLSSCGGTVDCAILCKRTLQCDVTFQNADDPDGDKIASGERTLASACEIGCEESEYVSVESARCADEVTLTDDASCNEDMASCFGFGSPDDELQPQ